MVSEVGELLMLGALSGVDAHIVLVLATVAVVFVAGAVDVIACQEGRLLLLWLWPRLKVVVERGKDERREVLRS